MELEDLQPVTIKTKVKAESRYRRFLEVSSLFLTTPLTKSEIILLDELYHLNKGKLTKNVRKDLCENMDISSQLLNNHIGSLRKKRIINNDIMHPMFLKPMPEGETFNMLIQMNVEL